MEILNNSKNSMQSKKTELIKESLDRLRLKLLDLTRRNNLVNFRETRRTIKILNDDVDTLFKRLVIDSKSFDLSPFEENDENDHIVTNRLIEKQKALKKDNLKLRQQNFFSTMDQLELPIDSSLKYEEKYFVILGKCNLTKKEISEIQSKYDWIKLNWKDKYEIFNEVYEQRYKSNPLKDNEPTNIIEINAYKSEKILQTTLLPQNLERRCKNILQHWKTGIEETGINFLYLSIGFLKWYEASYSNEEYLSPIILIPLRIERSRLNNKTKCYTYSINYSGEDIDSNTSILERLKSDFGLLLPELPEDLSPKLYLDDLKRIISTKKHWEVVNDVYISFYSFANIRLYKDLDEKNWPSSALPSNHNLIQTIIHGKDNPSSDPVTFGEVLDTDNLKNSRNLPLVMDADSSQRTAINECAYNDKNMVIVGPPGTGKSQTITNLIAASLINNKSVLFVSEKKAALEVVRKRLDSVGLGDFCLELHSHKTQKGQLLKDIGTRLKAKYVDSHALDLEIDRYLNEREKLKIYYKILTKICSNTNYNIYEILWKSERWLSEIEGNPVSNYFSNSLKLDRIEIDTMTYLLQDFSSLFNQLPFEVLEYWFGFVPLDLYPGNENDVTENIDKLSTTAKKLYEYIEEISGSLNGHIDYTLGKIHFWSKVDFNILNERNPKWNNNLIRKLSDDIVVTKLKNFVKLIDKYHIYKNEFEQGYFPLRNYSTEELNEACKNISILIENGFAEKTINDVTIILNKVKKIIALIEEIEIRYQDIKEFYVIKPSKVSEYLKILKLYKFFNNMPAIISFKVHPKHTLNYASDYLQQARKTHERILHDLNVLSEFFEIENVPDYQSLTRIKKVFKQNCKFPKKWFSRDYRSIRKETLVFLKDKKIFKDPQLFSNLEILCEIIKNSEEFNNQIIYKTILGPLFSGIHTDWENLSKSVEFCKELLTITGSQRISENMVNDFAGYTDKVRILFPDLIKIWKLLLNTAKSFKIRINNNHKLELLKNELIDSHKILHKSYERLLINDIFQQTKLNKLKIKYENGIKAFEIFNSIESDDTLHNILGSYYNSVDTNNKEIKEILFWANKIKLYHHFSKEISTWILNQPKEPLYRIIKQLVFNTGTFIKTLDKFIRELGRFGNFEFFNWIDSKSANKTTIDKIINKLDNSGDCNKYLLTFADYCRMREKVKKNGLTAFLKSIENRELNNEEIIKNLLYSIYASMAKEIVTEHPELATFQRAEYDNTIKRLDRADQQIKKLTVLRISSHLSKNAIPDGVGSGYVRDYSELSLIKHELTKRRRHIPIRQLVNRAGNALQAIKPCFMMSPLSVAQYLSPGEISFDLLVMDEASQLKLESAIGAVGRCKQMVVVGDPKQLPPTTFFQRISFSEDNIDEFTAAEEAESILDICQNCFDNYRLKWHYRSEHEKLIEFSNNQFYDDDLIIFPSPKISDDLKGIFHHFIPSAKYKKGRNKVEANCVAIAIKNHFEKNPHLSLGVATFNQEQRDLIYDELERIHKEPENFWLEEKILKSDKTDEPFFIKNLENVQGDERDVIFISTTYGPDSETGQVYQRFGPINNPLGWRRLNVLITRAKKRIDLFTSLNSSDIKIQANSSLGVIAFHKYLKYVETGKIIELGNHSYREPANDFEITVSKTLDRNGYRTIAQVGVAGYYIDIGVLNPKNENEFILGIECDGASYHSAQSIRDRDLIRQKILEKKGWKIYRIWSTDWYKNRHHETQTLLKYLNNIIPSYKSEAKEAYELNHVTQKVDDFEPNKEVYKSNKEIICKVVENTENSTDFNSDQKLRELLVEYRTKKLGNIVSDMSKCILSDKLLDEFIKVKPLSVEEFQKFPLRLRENIELGQTQHLDEIFEIIEEYI